MKTLFAFCAAALLSLHPLAAQEIMSPGTIASFSKEDGTMKLLPESRTGRPLLFTNMNKAPVQYASGAMGSTYDLKAGQSAAIYYRKVGERWYVSRIVIPDPPKPVATRSLTRAERHALGSKAANDRDITTQPGSKALIDRDITTQPGKKMPWDRDITKH